MQIHPPQKTRRVNSRGPSVTMLVYDFSEKGGKIFSKSGTEKLEKRVVFGKRFLLDFENKGWKYVSDLG